MEPRWLQPVAIGREPLQDPAVELAFWLRETAQVAAASPLRADRSHLERGSRYDFWN
jgi:hypothetical protein